MTLEQYFAMINKLGIMGFTANAMSIIDQIHRSEWEKIAHVIEVHMAWLTYTMIQQLS